MKFIPGHARLILLAVVVISLGACKPRDRTPFAPSGLRAHTTYHTDTIVHLGPLRMFTAAGEITDAATINEYATRRSYLFTFYSFPSSADPFSIYTDYSEFLNYFGRQYFTSVEAGLIHMLQADTAHSISGSGPSNALYKLHKSYYEMLTASVDIHGGWVDVTAVDSTRYQLSEWEHIRGTYNNDIITLPYTFAANWLRGEAHPYSVKASPAPIVPPGDTFLLWNGQLQLRRMLDE